MDKIKFVLFRKHISSYRVGFCAIFYVGHFLCGHYLRQSINVVQKMYLIRLMLISDYFFLRVYFYAVMHFPLESRFTSICYNQLDASFPFSVTRSKLHFQGLYFQFSSDFLKYSSHYYLKSVMKKLLVSSQISGKLFVQLDSTKFAESQLFTI